jgi:hypothetical protein
MRHKKTALKKKTEKILLYSATYIHVCTKQLEQLTGSNSWVKIEDGDYWHVPFFCGVNKVFMHNN